MSKSNLYNNNDVYTKLSQKQLKGKNTQSKMDEGESDEKLSKDKSPKKKACGTFEKASVEHCKTTQKIPISSLIKREKVCPFPKKKKIRSSKPTSYVPSVDTSRSKSSSDVVNMAIRKLRWKEFPLGRRSGCDIYWFGGAFEIPDNLPEKGMLNKYSGMSDATHKVELTKQLNRMKKLFPQEYSFYPKTWILPNEYPELIAFVSKNPNSVYIVKPDIGSQGDGIFLLNNPYDVHFSPLLAKPCVVQRYIESPLLLEKFKFDLRIYVILKSIEPLEIYICREGMARFCTEPYNLPTTKNLHKSYMHLTNYSLNKFSSTYVQSEEHDKGSKRKLSCVFKQLEKNGEDIVKLWSDIDDIICRTIIAFVPNLKIDEDAAVLDKELKVKLKCFQILGFDILLDSDLKPVLLEVNSSPSLRIDHDEETITGKVEYFVSPTDVEIKLPVVTDTMRLVYHYRQRGDGDSISSPEEYGCLKQLYPKRASHFNYLRILERCLDLYKRFVGVRSARKMGPTSFRMMARRCCLTEFNCTLAAMDILFINISRRFSACDNGRAALDFNAFVEMLLTISQRGLSIQGRQPIDNLRYILRHCEINLEKPKCRKQHLDKLPVSPLVRRSMKSTFSLPTSPAV